MGHKEEVTEDSWGWSRGAVLRREVAGKQATRAAGATWQSAGEGS